jgi:hypothetical protein
MGLIRTLFLSVYTSLFSYCVGLIFLHQQEKEHWQHQDLMTHEEDLIISSNTKFEKARHGFLSHLLGLHSYPSDQGEEWE